MAHRARQTPRRLLLRSGVPRIAREAHLAVLRVEGSALNAFRRRRSQRLAAPIRVLGYTPSYLPDSPGGSEVTLHSILTGFRARGHDTRVLVHAGKREVDAVDRVEVTMSDWRGDAARLFKWADVVFAQLGTRQRAIRLAARYHRPLAFYVQIGNTPRHALFGNPDLNVFNSELTRSQYPWVKNSMVFHPPIDVDSYRTTPGDSVTLLNISEMKGGALFWQIAERLPDHSFVGVKGWGRQVIAGPVPPNVTLLERTVDIRSVYASTRVLLVPSVYESYGRVALEAACSGIPTIAHPSEGVREAMGDAAFWADRDDVNAWVAAVEALDDPVVYGRYAQLALDQVNDLDPCREFDALEQRLIELALRYR
jgi:glycosyltransferase involved in cell wall biosynthesis